MDSVKKLFPDLFRDPWPSNFSGPFVPLVVGDGCNACAKVPFSSATLTVTANNKKSVPEAFLYRGAMYDLVYKKSGPMSIQRDEAVNCLGKFLTSENHLKCLREMKNRKMCEAEIQSTLAVHLFAPLLPNSSCIIADQRSYQRHIKPECPTCKTAVKTGDTSFGNSNTWHGYADIILDRNAVKIETEGESNKELEIAVVEGANMGSGEPCSKRSRIERLGSDGGEAGKSDDEEWRNNINIVEIKLASSDRYMPYGPDNMIMKEYWNETLSQVLAQTIVNAFLQAKKHPTVGKDFIPCFLTSEKYITIHMYNPIHDILITQSYAMSIWQKDFPQSIKIDTVVSLWLALNMDKFSRIIPIEEKEKLADITKLITKSGFHTIAGPKLEIFEHELKAPLDGVPDRAKVHDYKCSDELYAYVRETIDSLRKNKGML